MKAVATQETNFVLKGREGVADLPVTRVEFSDGQIGVQSCWQLSEKEKEEIMKTGMIYFLCLAPTHAPVCLLAVSATDPRMLEFEKSHAEEAKKNG